MLKMSPALLSPSQIAQSWPPCGPVLENKVQINSAPSHQQDLLA